MDEAKHRLVVELSTEAGEIMEDAAPIALRIGLLAPVEREGALSELEQQVDRIQRLLAAAQALASS